MREVEQHTRLPRLLDLDDSPSVNQRGQIFPPLVPVVAIPGPRSGERKHTADFASNLIACP